MPEASADEVYVLSWSWATQTGAKLEPSAWTGIRWCCLCPSDWHPLHVLVAGLLPLRSLSAILGCICVDLLARACPCVSGVEEDIMCKVSVAEWWRLLQRLVAWAEPVPSCLELSNLLKQSYNKSVKMVMKQKGRCRVKRVRCHAAARRRCTGALQLQTSATTSLSVLKQVCPL